MRTAVMGVVLAMWAASAAAGPSGRDDGTDPGYSARIYYRLDFNTAGDFRHNAGLRFAVPGADALAGPATFQWSRDNHGTSLVSVGGMPLRGPSPALGADDDGRNRGFFAMLTPGEWVAVGGTLLGVALLVGHGGGDNGVAGSGGS